MEKGGVGGLEVCMEEGRDLMRGVENREGKTGNEKYAKGWEG